MEDFSTRIIIIVLLLLKIIVMGDGDCHNCLYLEIHIQNKYNCIFEVWCWCCVISPEHGRQGGSAWFLSEHVRNESKSGVSSKGHRLRAQRGGLAKQKPASWVQPRLDPQRQTRLRIVYYCWIHRRGVEGQISNDVASWSLPTSSSKVLSWLYRQKGNI